MGESVKTIEYQCTVCGSRFQYKAAMPGRRVLCACGKPAVPFTGRAAAAPPAPALPATDEYDLADDGGTPAATGKSKATKPAVASKSATASTTVATVQPQPDIAALYPTRQRPAPADDDNVDTEFKPLRDVVAPLVILAIGVTAWLAMALHNAPADKSRLMVMFIALCLMIITSGAALGGALAAVLLVSINLGKPATAALKIAATAIIATVSWMLTYQVGFGSAPGAAIGLCAMFLVYGFSIRGLFDVDMQESLLMTIIIFIVTGLVAIGVLHR
jgi:hypothetical protein